MRTLLLSVVSAVTLGLAGGYAWSSMAPASADPSGRAKATTIPLPASPEEQPAALDREWTERADDRSPPAATGSGPVDRSVHYAGCNAVRAAGKAPLDAGDPGYRSDMDGDGDGIACEPIRGD